ncbi:3'-5' exoribonuclease YhaM family protein [Terriglobus sp.]|uniref:3'-5' exoribonuclease YhaM family protein n=1 Tax=Terriglobus sp. TaxID=1889013 RepID=UPI003B008E7E
MKNFYVSSAAQRVNQEIHASFVVSAASQRERKGGGAYLAMTLTDRTGSMEGRMWKPTPETLQWFRANCYVAAKGRIEAYNGTYQICVEELQQLEIQAIDIADYQRVSRYNEDLLWQKLVAYVDGFSNPHLQALVRCFLDDPELSAAFRQAPAAKSLHHAWIRGLLEHVVFLLRLCEIVAPHYKDDVDADLLMTGAILHDIGKVRELAWERSFTYTTEGQLLGHITIGIGMVREKAAALPGFPDRLRILVEHLILSHHGRYEFGSPKLPMTPEAIIFSALDDLEAKMQNMRAEFAKAADSGRAADEVTEYSRSMERALLNSRIYLAGDPNAGSTASVKSSSASSEATDADEFAAAEKSESVEGEQTQEEAFDPGGATAVADSTTENALPTATSEEIITLFGAR